MKRILPLTLLLSLVLHAQTVPPDHSPDRTHKSKHERTPYYAKDGKTHCGVLVEMKNGQWRAIATGKGFEVNQAFDTRAEAHKWLSLYCPVAGKVGHD